VPWRRRLDDDLVESWLTHRNDVGALAPLWQHGVAVDTIEVAGPWARLSEMRALVTAALMDVPGMAVASVHQSHAYLDGACLYFTFAGRPESDDDLTGFYRQAWTLPPPPSYVAAVRSVTTTASGAVVPVSWPRRWAAAFRFFRDSNRNSILRAS